MGLYYTIAGTKTIQVGDNLNGTYSDITITPIDPDTGVHTGYHIQASNFKIGGGEESDGSGSAATGTNIYENLSETWNVDTGVTKVVFTNNSNTPDDINNTVKARVHFGSVSPSAAGNINIDIDERTDNPFQLAPSRKVCFQVWLKYDTNVTYEFYQPSINTHDWTVAANPYLGVTRTQTDDGTTDGWIKYKFEGTINSYVESQVYDLIRVGVLRANLGLAIDTLPTVSAGVTEPNFSTHDFYITNDHVSWAGTPPQYVNAYNHELFQITNTNNQAYVIGATLSYNPLDTDGFSELEDGDFCGLGHTFKIDHRIFQPADPVDAGDEIYNVTFPPTLPNTCNHETIVVKGTVGAKYSLNLQKMESTTSTKVTNTAGYYSFSGGLRGFKDVISRPKSNEFTIDSSGRKHHNFILPKTTSAERYEVFITPVGTTKAKSGVPTKAGEGTILRDGITTITIQAEADTEANWQLSGDASESGVTPVRTRSFSRRKTAQPHSNHFSISARAASAVSASTKLVLDREYRNIQPGMYVITPMAGDGVPYNTKVSAVRNRTVILSANCTIAQNADVIFESNTSQIFPFNLTIPAGFTTGSEMITTDYTDNGTFTNDNGNWSALDTTGGDVTLSRSGTKMQVTTTTDNEIEGAELADDYMDSTVVGQVYRVSMDLQLTTPSSGTMSMQMGIGGGLSSAFDITTTETTYTKDIVATSTDGHLLIYNTSATASVFTVDNVSVKRLSYKNLTATNTDPSNSLGGTSEGLTAVVDGNTTNSNDVTVVSPGQRKVQVGMIVRSNEIAESTGVKGVNTSTRVITMNDPQSLTSGTTLTFNTDPDLTTPVTTDGVYLIHAHATISEAGSVNNQEVAQVYGYLRVNRPTETVTLPFYLDTILTSGGFS
jgi:hypothetical protein